MRNVHFSGSLHALLDINPISEAETMLAEKDFSSIAKRDLSDN